MSALDGAGAVHSMPSYELCERGVLVQQRFGVASTRVVKARAIRALGVFALDDAKHREPYPTRRRMPPSAARSCQGDTPRRAAAMSSAIT